MSNTRRNTLAILLTILMALSAFAGGYFLRDFMDQAQAADPAASFGERDMAVFWEAWQRVEENFTGVLPTAQERTYGAIRGSVSLLNDPYTFFVEPQAREQERESLSGRFGGIGATLQRNEAGDVLLSPLPGNPAQRAGILEGDVLLAVDGQAITADMTVQAIAERIKGEVGTQVTLTVRHPQATQPVEITIERDEILVPSVFARPLEQDPTIGYIQLTRFSAESGHELSEAITGLHAQGVDKLILDLRQNGGGLLDAAVDVSDLFLSQGLIVTQRGDGARDRAFRANAGTLVPDEPLILLVDGGTASASEIVAGALRDNGRARLVGQRTFGKGSVQLIFDLSDGSSIHVTSARWITPAGVQLDGQGLEPDVPVQVSQEAIDNGRDETLERAIALLQEKD